MKEGQKMKYTVPKVRRPHYFIANDTCIRISSITFACKAGASPFSCSPAASECAVAVGISTQQQPVFIPCKNQIEQTAIFAQLATMLSAL